MKRRRMIRSSLWIIPFVLIAVGGWFLYLNHLTGQLDRACGPVPSAQRNDPGYANLQTLLDEYSATHGNVGLQATVIFPDETTWSGATGFASHENACPLTLEHHLYIGSMTKLFTANLVMRQVEQGNIRLKDPIRNWFDFPFSDQVTVEMLLNHTSGIPNYTEYPWFLARYFGQPQKDWQLAEIIEQIEKDPLNFEPGSKHSYSNSNYVLLGAILEKVTGASYSDLIIGLGAEFGLTDTSYLASPPDLLIANAYDQSLLHLGRPNLTGFRQSFVSGAYAAGGVLSNSQDVANFVHSSFTGQSLSSETLAQMLSTIDAPDEDVPAQTGYGFGLRYFEIDGEHFVGHSGTIPGYSGIVMHNLDKGYTVAILSNLSTIDQLSLLDAFRTTLHSYPIVQSRSTK